MNHAHTLDHLYTNESRARAATGAKEQGCVFPTSVCAWTHRCRILNEPEPFSWWENTKEKLSRPSCPKTIFLIWQLSKATSSQANLPAVFLYLAQSSFPARLAQKYICILFLQHLLLWWKQGSYTRLLIEAAILLLLLLLLLSLFKGQQFSFYWRLI